MFKCSISWQIYCNKLFQDCVNLFSSSLLYVSRSWAIDPPQLWGGPPASPPVRRKTRLMLQTTQRDWNSQRSLKEDPQHTHTQSSEMFPFQPSAVRLSKASSLKLCPGTTPPKHTPPRHTVFFFTLYILRSLSHTHIVSYTLQPSSTWANPLLPLKSNRQEMRSSTDRQISHFKLIIVFLFLKRS